VKVVRVVLNNGGRILRLALIVVIGAATLTTAIAVTMPRVGELVASHRFERDSITLTTLSERSYVYDRHGNKMATFVAAENRVQVDISDVPRTVIDSVLSAEDSAFFSHNGVNVRSIGRALTANIESGGVDQGGSTITQQVVKNIVLDRKQDFPRKVKEASLALKLEERYTKDEILEHYLNTIYLGNGAYGVQAAAEVYFRKDVSMLTWAEGALLAGVIRCPVNCDPFKRRSRAFSRRNTVLDGLVATGRLLRREADLNKLAAMPDEPYRPRKPDDYFVEEVQRQLLADERLGETPTARYNRLFGGGLRVYTTFDPELYLKALRARNETLTGNAGDATFPLSPDPVTGATRFGTAAMAGVEPKTGAVRFLVGGPGFDRYQYNLALQSERQTGSSFKTFVLTAAMVEGYSPNDTINGAGPCRDIPGYPEDNPPRNFGGSTGRTASLKSQTLSSSNCAFLRLNQVVGPEKVAFIAHRMGVTSELNPEYASMAIGAQGVSPLDMAASYSVLANDGVRNPAYYIDRVEEADGNVLFAHEADPEQVIPVNAARLVTDILEANVESGTGTNAQLGDQPAAGKTGTTNGPSDVWFVGYTPQLSVSVWIGGTSDNRPLESPYESATGGRYPATTWGAFMRSALEGVPVEEFTEPEPVSGGNYLCMRDDEGGCRRQRRGR
jgi:penicillin-binding protein 1A